MIIKTTREQVFTLYRELFTLSGVSGAKFAYGIARNLKLLEPIVKEITSVYPQPSEEYIKYDTARADLAKKYAKVDDKGNPIIIKVDGHDEYDMADNESFNKEFEALKEQNAEVIKVRGGELEAYKKYRDGEIDVDIHVILKENLPEEIKAEQLLKIYPLLEQEQNEPKD